MYSDYEDDDYIVYNSNSHDMCDCGDSDCEGCDEKIEELDLNLSDDDLEFDYELDEEDKEIRHGECAVCCAQVQGEVICDECHDIGWWVDPVGGVHSPNEDDPAKAYE